MLARVEKLLKEISGAGTSVAPCSIRIL